MDYQMTLTAWQITLADAMCMQCRAWVCVWVCVCVCVHVCVCVCVYYFAGYAVPRCMQSSFNSDIRFSAILKASYAL